MAFLNILLKMCIILRFKFFLKKKIKYDTYIFFLKFNIIILLKKFAILEKIYNFLFLIKNLLVFLGRSGTKLSKGLIILAKILEKINFLAIFLIPE
jgi:hypothetical protein